MLVKTKNCFYKGFLVNFITWEPNWLEEKLNKISYWLEIKNLPPEIKHLKTLIKIGNLLGKLIGIESDYYKESNIKFLIETDSKPIKPVFKKLITNRSIYNLEFTIYEGESFGIIIPSTEIGFKATNIKETLSFICQRKGSKSDGTVNWDSQSKINDRREHDSEQLNLYFRKSLLQKTPKNIKYQIILNYQHLKSVINVKTTWKNWRLIRRN